MKRSGQIQSIETAYRGFTLMEMVMVMGIIILILGGAVALLGGAKQNAEVQKAHIDISNGIPVALDSYKNLAKRYPTTQQGLKALVTKPTTPPIPKLYSPPFTGLPLDPWGNEYVYESDGYTYLIISKGPDRVLKTDDDIRSDIK